MQTEENNLELALRRASSDAAQRPDFYKALLDAKVFVLGQSDSPSSGLKTIEAGTNISIESWARNDGSPIIPFFTSLHALQVAIDHEVRYMELPARAFFEITQGSTLVLNPKGQYGKEFFPQEIEALLASGVNRLPEQRVLQKPTEVLLGQPAHYPTAMMGALATLFSHRSNVKAAYLLLMHDRSVDEKPHLVVGIEADSDIEQLIREAGVVAGDMASAGEPVDLVRVTPGEKGLSEYFLQQVKPFYERRPGGLKALLGLGHG